MHPSILFGLLTLLLYGVGSTLTTLRIFNKWNVPKNAEFLVSLGALLCHTITLYYLIETPAGQNLSLVNIACLITWIAMLFITVAMIWLPLQNLLLLIEPVALGSIVLALIFPKSHIIPTRLFPLEMAHIFLSILGSGLLLIATIQALLIGFQERRLRQVPGKALTTVLPPIQIMEKLLFEFMRVGLVVLSFAVVSGLLAWKTAVQQPIFYKLALSLVAWFVFATLLWGRKHFGWRGFKIAQGTLIGMSVLVVAYFGSYCFP